MKIKNRPVFSEITCTKCGTVFLPEPEDDIICTGIDDNGVNTLEIECPTCGTYHRCIIIAHDWCRRK
jgi:ribosomal protein S27AE